MRSIIGALVHDECGSQYIQHLSFTICMAILAAGLVQVGQGAGGKIWNKMVEQGAFAYANNFERGAPAGFINVKPATAKTSGVQSQGLAPHSLVELGRIKVDSVVLGRVGINATGPVVAVPGWLLGQH